MNSLSTPDSNRRWDCVGLGEVMLRLDPGEMRIHTTRHFNVWEGGGEYNVARGLRRCFGLRAAVATALADNPVGRLVEDFILEGGVDTSLIRWVRLRWRRPHRAQRPQLYRARLRPARRRWLFRPRPHRHQPGQARRLRLGVDLRPDEWLALVPYRRHLRRALRFHRRGRRRSHGRRAQIRARPSPTT